MIVELMLLALCVALAVALAMAVKKIRELSQPQEVSLDGERKDDGSPGAEILSSLIDALGDACIVIDGESRILFSNEAVPNFFGGLAPLPGTSIEKVIHNHRVLDFVRELATEKQAGDREFEVAAAKGTAAGAGRTVSCSVSPLTFSGQGGKNGHMSLLFRDVTSERETERIRKDFVANASHELRTPLSIINGYIENLLDGTVESTEETTRALETMARHGDRIARIVEDMLTISRFESGDAESLLALRASKFDLEACASDVVSRLAPVIEENRTEVEIGIDPDARQFDGDRSYWDQVFFNLVDNAIKENVGNPVRIKIRGHRLPDGGHKIMVSDDGVGIPTAHLTFVFKRFYRVAKHHSRSQIKGTGLGLSIVKRAVEAHGGTITLTSTPGVDTTFAMTVPPLSLLG